MNLPLCPNFRQHVCERSAIRLLGENDNAWLFTCATCSLFWAVTKDRTKDKGRYEARMAAVQRASDMERERTRRRIYSFPTAR